MMQWLLLATLAPALANFDEPPVTTPAPLRIDILVKQPVEKCETQSADEIVVCAEKTETESQRLRPIANAGIYEKDESRADFGIAENVRMAAEVDSEELGAGVISKRIMARVKIKF
jgi:hypothetical protein